MLEVGKQAHFWLLHWCVSSVGIFSTWLLKYLGKVFFNTDEKCSSLAPTVWLAKKKKSSLAFASLSLPSLRVRFESQHQNGRKFRRQWGKNNPLQVGIDEWAVLSRLILRSLQPSLTMFLKPSCMSVTNFLEAGQKKNPNNYLLQRTIFIIFDSIVKW